MVCNRSDYYKRTENIMTLTTAEASAIFRSAPDRHLDVGAGEAAYRRVGNGPDVLFVHGWPVSGATFRLLLPYLVDHVTCHLIDLPSAGSSRFDAATPLSIAQHIESVRRVVDLLKLDEVAVVGHDSGGLIARHAMAGDPRLRAMGLINTEPPHPSWRFRSFIAARHLPGFAAGFGWVAGNPKIRRIGLVLGDAFADASLLDGEFDEFFLTPLNEIPERRNAAVRLLRSFDYQLVNDLADVHRRIDVPVQLVWGDRDPFFPIAQAEDMVDTFPDARLATIAGAGLFSHEEQPAAVAAALLPVLTGDW
jgi:pimeloyl-ACP methyl ester carboxylesterase